MPKPMPATLSAMTSPMPSLPVVGVEVGGAEQHALDRRSPAGACVFDNKPRITAPRKIGSSTIGREHDGRDDERDHGGALGRDERLTDFEVAAVRDVERVRITPTVTPIATIVHEPDQRPPAEVAPAEAHAEVGEARRPVPQRRLANHSHSTDGP